MTNYDKIKSMNVEERKKYFNHSHATDDTLYRDRFIIKDINIAASNPRICKNFAKKNCEFENPTNNTCYTCTRKWLESEVEEW